MSRSGLATYPRKLANLAEQIRSNFSLFEGNEWGVEPTKVMFAWVEQESNWNRWATREERGFFRRYILPKITDKSISRERWDRATSFGLLQMMGQVAREQGFNGPYLSQMLVPEVNLYYCVRYLAEDRRPKTDGTWAGALAAYNGGLRGNKSPPYRKQSYVDSVLARTT